MRGILRSSKLSNAAAVAAMVCSAGLVALAPTPAAAEAELVDGPFQIAPIPTNISYLSSQVAAYDHERDRHLVASVAHPSSGAKWSVHTALVDGRGGRIGSPVLTDITVGVYEHASFSPNALDVAYNPTADEYLVVWTQSTGPNSQVPQGARWAIMFAQRYSASGARIGGTIRLNSSPGTNAVCGYSDPAIAYNSATGGYVLAFLYGMKQLSVLDASNAGQCPGVQGYSPNALRVASIPVVPGVDSVTGVNVPGGLQTGRAHAPEIARHPTTGEFLVTWGTPTTRVADNTAQPREQRAHRISTAGQPVGSPILVSSPGYGDAKTVVSPVTGNWVVAAVSQGDGVKVHFFRPNGTRVGSAGTIANVRGVDGVLSFVALSDGSFLLGTYHVQQVSHLDSTGVRLGDSLRITGSAILAPGKAGAPTLVVGRGAQGTTLRNQTVGSLVTVGAGKPVVGIGQVQRLARLCVGVAGSVSDVALLNLTPVAASAPGNGQLISSDVTGRPEASNVNFAPGTVDPNVAAAPLGADGKVCYLNSEHASVHVIADHLASVSKAAITLATPTGAPQRKVDTRSGLGGGMVGPNGRVCFAVAGSPGDVALVNLTPVLASDAGDGQLVSSDVKSPPVASNVNFAPGTVDPNVAAAPIGADGRVCYVNSAHSSVHVIADHLASISKSAVTLATPTGAPQRKVDTRSGLGGGMVPPNGRVCFAVAGSPGGVALVNLTPVGATGAGDGQLVSSDVKSPPVASNVNFAPGSVDPNVAAAPVGADGKVCYVNSAHSSVHIVADHLASISKSAITLATATGAPARRIDTRAG